MVRATGLSRATYLRLEQGKFDNPPLRYLISCAVVLEVPVMRLTQPEWRRWLTGEVAPQPRRGRPTRAARPSPESINSKRAGSPP